MRGSAFPVSGGQATSGFPHPLDLAYHLGGLARSGHGSVASVILLRPDTWDKLPVARAVSPEARSTHS